MTIPKNIVPETEWDQIIRPKRNLLDINFREIWQYRDLHGMFVKRDIVTVYKQTILGPLWFILQPLLTTATYILVFGRIAKLSTDGLPMILFYLSGIIVWNYFSECFTITSKTFIENANVFGKVYFPRLISPVSKVTSGLIKFAIQLCLFLGFFFYYLFTTESIHPNIYLLLTPYLILLMGGLGLGFGIIFTSLTTKYRDLNFLITFGVQLLMYATPVIYPLSSVEGNLKTILMLNPMSSILETFKYGFFGSGTMSWNGLLYTTVFTIMMLFIGIVIFNRTERSFIDSV